MVRQNGYDIAKSLEKIHESIVEWTERADEILPDSWQHGDQYTTHQLKVSNTVAEIFEPGAGLEDNPTTLLDEPNAIMTGLLLHCAKAKGKAFSLADDLTDNHQDDKWTIKPADIADNISTIVEIAGEIMAIGYAALAGISIHAMGSANNNTDLETQYTSAIVRANSAIAYAGTLARAATTAEQFRTQPMP